MLRLFLLITFTPLITAKCPTGTVQGLSPNDCYKMVSVTGASWYTAQESCDGGSLVSVPNAFVNGFLQNVYGGWSTAYVWLGASETNGVWTWADGQPFRFTNWARGVLVNGSGMCMTAATDSGVWYTAPCNSIYPYICKVPPLPEATCTTPVPSAVTCPTLPSVIEPTCPICPTCAPSSNGCTRESPTEPTTSHTQCPSGWEYVEAVGSCWKALASPTWRNDLCNAENASWVSVHNPTTNFHLTNFLADYRYFGWLPLHKPIGKQWQWTDGTPFDFDNWDVNGTENCTASADCYIGINTFNVTWGNYGTWMAQSKPSAASTWVTYGYVCAKPPNPQSGPPQPTSPMPMKCPTTWTYVEKAQSCWKTFGPSQWNADLCLRYNANWVSIHDRQTNAAFAKFSSGNSWLSLRKRKNGQWQWMDGTEYDFAVWNTDDADDDCTNNTADCYAALNITASSRMWSAYNTPQYGYNYVCAVEPSG